MTIFQMLAARQKRWDAERDSPGYACAHPRVKDGLAIVGSNPSRLALDESAMSATFVISTMRPDRVGDVVVPEGIVLENYRRNPVVLFGHQSASLPIGKSEDPDGNLTIVVRPQREVVATCF